MVGVCGWSSLPAGPGGVEEHQEMTEDLVMAAVAAAAVAAAATVMTETATTRNDQGPTRRVPVAVAATVAVAAGRCLATVVAPSLVTEIERPVWKLVVECLQSPQLEVPGLQAQEAQLSSLYSHKVGLERPRLTQEVIGGGGGDVSSDTDHSASTHP